MLTEKAPNPGEDDEDYYVPEEQNPEPIKRPTPPDVKRFNRKMILLILAAIAVATVLAFGTALTRERLKRQAEEAAALKAPANLNANDAINSLPSDYSQIPKLGTPLPGDVGEIAQASLQGNGNQPRYVYQNQPMNNQPRQLDPFEQYEQQQLLEQYKRQVRARESAFSFPNDGASQNLAMMTKPSTGSNDDDANATFGKSTERPDEDNYQDEKKAFLNSGGSKETELRSHVKYPKSPYTIFSGTIIPGIMITGINSDLPGQIVGSISQNVFDTVTGNHLLLPQDTRVIGQYDSRVTYGQQRVLVVWTRLIRPDGSSISLEGMPGVDLSGYAGLTGDVDRHILRLLGAVVLGSVLQAGAQSGTNVGISDQTIGDRARQGIGSGISSSTNQMVRKELQLQPTITVEPGERFNVFVTKDIQIPPFKD